MGLDYTALSLCASWLDIKIDTSMFRKIRILEAETLNDLYGRKADKANKPCKHPDACAMCRKTCTERAV